MAMAGGSADSYDLDALAVSDRFRLFNFTRRDDYLAYLWVLRAMDRLRGMHVAQSHTDDVAAVLTELAAAHDGVPPSVGNLRERLDYLSDDGVLHRLEDASRAGSLARYRNRQSVYQFTELGHRAYTAVEGVLAARLQDANLSRLVFSDIVRDLRGLAEANRDGDGDEIVRRLGSLDRVMEDMARRSARFHLTLGDITRSTDASPEMFLRYKHALMAHMSDFMAEPDRSLPRLAQARQVPVEFGHEVAHMRHQRVLVAQEHLRGRVRRAGDVAERQVKPGGPACHILHHPVEAAQAAHDLVAITVAIRLRQAPQVTHDVGEHKPGQVRVLQPRGEHALHRRIRPVPEFGELVDRLPVPVPREAPGPRRVFET